jgi:hypothetical protein
MRTPDPASEQEARALLREMCGRQDVSQLSAEDREALRGWWARVYEEADPPEPEEISFAGLQGVAMFYDPASEGLEARLIPFALIFRAFDSVIREGLSGAEHLAEEFLCDCGFDEASARQMLEQMVSRAPLPDPEDLN